MRRFEVFVWADYQRQSEIIEFEDSASDEKIDAVCKKACEAMIYNRVDSGWYEFEDGGEGEDERRQS